MVDAILEGRSLRKTYFFGEDRSFDALAGVDLRVERGSYVAIVGPSGSGKSTLLHLLGALDTPTEGEVLYEGRSLAGLGDRERARLRGELVGFVFQTFNLVPRITALRNVMLPMSFRRNGFEGDRREHAMELLRSVGLGERAGHASSELSGGERQRVAIARALVNDPKVLLADEPTGNLDTATGEQVLDILDRLHREGRTIVVITHDPAVARRAERIVHMRDGHIESTEAREAPGDDGGDPLETTASGGDA